MPVESVSLTLLTLDLMTLITVTTFCIKEFIKYEFAGETAVSTVKSTLDSAN